MDILQLEKKIKNSVVLTVDENGEIFAKIEIKTKGQTIHTKLDLIDLPILPLNKTINLGGGYASFKTGPARASLHRYILGISDTKAHVDHIDGDKLNNRRNNLRICSQRQNNQNKQCHRAGKLPGVRQKGKKFQSRIEINKVECHLGMFHTAIAASARYFEAIALFESGKTPEEIQSHFGIKKYKKSQELA